MDQAAAEELSIPTQWNKALEIAGEGCANLVLHSHLGSV